MSSEPGLQGLDALRGRIDECDATVLRAISSRFAAVEAIGRLKREAGVAVLQPRRRQEVIDRYRAVGVAAGLSDAFAEALALLVLEEAHRIEEEVAAGGASG